MTILEKQAVDVFAGDSHILAFAVVDNGGDAIDLTGATIKWKLSRADNTPTIIIKTISGGITVSTPASGQFTVALSQTDTSLLNGLYYFQALVIDGNGNQSVIAHGDLNVNKSIEEI